MKLVTSKPKSNLFIISLDNKREYFRYHHLFSELLSKRLIQVYPNLVRTLHIAASKWHRQKLNMEESIYHAFTIRNYDLVAELAEQFGNLGMTRKKLFNLVKKERDKRYRRAWHKAYRESKVSQ